MGEEVIPYPGLSPFTFDVLKERRIVPLIVLIFNGLVVVVLDRIDMLVHKGLDAVAHF